MRPTLKDGAPKRLLEPDREPLVIFSPCTPRGVPAEPVEQRATALAQAGDQGVRTSMAIADRVDQLEDFKGAARARG